MRFEILSTVELDRYFFSVIIFEYVPFDIVQNRWIVFQTSSHQILLTTVTSPCRYTEF